MHSPFEELEYLAEYLPDEGEIVLVTRESGELVCKPWTKTDLRDGVDDAELYGMLVHANEQLHNVGALPLWIFLIGLTWLLIGLFGFVGLTWNTWYFVPLVAIPALGGCYQWIRSRQRKHFRQNILPVLTREMTRRGIAPYSLIGGVRQHGELRTLLDELVRWNPEGEAPLT